MNTSKIPSVFYLWLPIAAIVTIFCGLVYATIQQNYRQNANDPQIQMAEDGATVLARGEDADSILPLDGQVIDIARSLAPFAIVYDVNGKVLTGGGELHDEIPTPPLGVFEYAKTHGVNRVTWQPEKGVRVAAVVMPYGGNTPGFILAGRSLREVERRETQLELLVFGAWISTLVLALALVLLRT
jgi:hypothetical protein